MRLARDLIFDAIRELGIHHLFGTPGTNELPIIDGVNAPGSEVDFVPCLHEGIAVAAAMGYARMNRAPGVVVLHVTPGIAHGLSNLYNAQASQVPLVVLCGQQHSELLLQEPFLSSNLVEMARQYTKWAYEVHSVDELPLVVQRAFKEAMTAPCGPVFLSVPWDLTLQETELAVRGITRVQTRTRGDLAAVEAAARRLVDARDPLLVVGDGAGYSGAWTELRELAELLGAPVYSEAISSLMNYPAADYHWQGELPTTQAGIQGVFRHADVAFLCGYGSQAPVVVFNYAAGPLIPATVHQVHLHYNAWELGKNDLAEVAILGDPKSTLPDLITAVRAMQTPEQRERAAARNAQLRRGADWRTEQWQQFVQRYQPHTPIVSALVADGLRQLQRQGKLRDLLYVHEAISDADPFLALPDYQDPDSYYCAQGGPLGYSMGGAIGLKLAAPHRTVVTAVGDGSTLFYPQVWWTAAQRQVPVLYLIMNNREYRTLKEGLEGLTELKPDWRPGQQPWLDLNTPALHFTEIARSFGMPAERVERVEDPRELLAALERGVAAVTDPQNPGPYVLELLTDPHAAHGPMLMAAGASGRRNLNTAKMAAPPMGVWLLMKEGKLHG